MLSPENKAQHELMKRCLDCAVDLMDLFTMTDLEYRAQIEIEGVSDWIDLDEKFLGAPLLKHSLTISDWPRFATTVATCVTQLQLTTCCVWELAHLIHHEVTEDSGMTRH